MKTFIEILVILSVIGGIGVYVVYTRSTKAITVEVSPVEIGDIILAVSAPGEIKSESEASLKFPSAGRIIYLPFSAGNRVEKNEALVSIDGTQTLKSLENARLDKKKAVDLADEIRETYEGQLDDGPGLYKLKQAEKAVEQAENQIKLYENALFNLTLYAPFSGTIIIVNKKVGETAQITDPEPIIKLADLETQYFQAQIDEEDLDQVSPGQKVLIDLDAYPEKILIGQLFEMEKTTTTDLAGNKVVKTKVRITKTDGATLRLGLSGDAEIIQQQRQNIIIIPIEAFFKEDGKTFVYLLEGQKATKKAISIGLENDDFVEVISGLKAGQKVIISDLDKISKVGARRLIEATD